jgi:hypothetical protein
MGVEQLHGAQVPACLAYLQRLAGRRNQHQPGLAAAGGLRLIVVGQEGYEDSGYVDLIHETLIRSREKDEKIGKL